MTISCRTVSWHFFEMIITFTLIFYLQLDIPVDDVVLLEVLELVAKEMGQDWSILADKLGINSDLSIVGMAEVSWKYLKEKLLILDKREFVKNLQDTTLLTVGMYDLYHSDIQHTLFNKIFNVSLFILINFSLFTISPILSTGLNLKFIFLMIFL